MSRWVPSNAASLGETLNWARFEITAMILVHKHAAHVRNDHLEVFTRILLELYRLMQLDI